MGPEILRLLPYVLAAVVFAYMPSITSCINGKERVESGTSI
jgi:hypothetical protein